MFGSVAFLLAIGCAAALGEANRKSKSNYHSNIATYNASRGKGTHAVLEFKYCCEELDKLIESHENFEAKGGWEGIDVDLYKTIYREAAYASGRNRVIAEGYTPCLPRTVPLYAKTEPKEGGISYVQRFNNNFGLNVPLDRRGY